MQTKVDYFPITAFPDALLFLLHHSNLPMIALFNCLGTLNAVEFLEECVIYVYHLHYNSYKLCCVS